MKARKASKKIKARNARKKNKARKASKKWSHLKHETKMKARYKVKTQMHAGA